jgi:adenosine kinase
MAYTVPIPVKENSIFCIGNPLLDISLPVGTDVLEKYGLAANNAILAEEKHLPLYRELASDPKVEYIAGGATQNSARVAQWLLDSPRAVTYAGSVGKDEFGAKLRAAATADGLRVEYHEDEETPTGTCAVVITGKDRSLVANLAAANKYKMEHLRSPVVWGLAASARLVYSAGFFLTVSPEAMRALGQLCSDNNKIFCTNLSAPFLVQFFKDQMMSVMPYVDILFGNEAEAAAFAEVHGFGTTDIGEIAQRISALPKVNELDHPRIVVITQGAERTVVARRGATPVYFDINRIASEKIVDTNGAGDAFVGGFIASYVQGYGVHAAVHKGHEIAATIIQRSGCTLPARTAPEHWGVGAMEASPMTA